MAPAHHILCVREGVHNCTPGAKRVMTNDWPSDVLEIVNKLRREIPITSRSIDFDQYEYLSPERLTTEYFCEHWLEARGAQILRFVLHKLREQNLKHRESVKDVAEDWKSKNLVEATSTDSLSVRLLQRSGLQDHREEFLRDVLEYLQQPPSRPSNNVQRRASEPIIPSADTDPRPENVNENSTSLPKLSTTSETSAQTQMVIESVGAQPTASSYEQEHTLNTADIRAPHLSQGVPLSNAVFPEPSTSTSNDEYSRQNGTSSSFPSGNYMQQWQSNPFNQSFYAGQLLPNVTPHPHSTVPGQYPMPNYGPYPYQGQPSHTTYPPFSSNNIRHFSSGTTHLIQPGVDYSNPNIMNYHYPRPQLQESSHNSNSEMIQSIYGATDTSHPETKDQSSYGKRHPKKTFTDDARILNHMSPGTFHSYSNPQPSIGFAGETLYRSNDGVAQSGGHRPSISQYHGHNSQPYPRQPSEISLSSTTSHLHRYTPNTTHYYEQSAVNTPHLADPIRKSSGHSELADRNVRTHGQEFEETSYDGIKESSNPDRQSPVSRFDNHHDAKDKMLPSFHYGSRSTWDRDRLKDYRKLWVQLFGREVYGAINSHLKYMNGVTEVVEKGQTGRMPYWFVSFQTLEQAACAINELKAMSKELSDDKGTSFKVDYAFATNNRPEPHNAVPSKISYSEPYDPQRVFSSSSPKRTPPRPNKARVASQASPGSKQPSTPQKSRKRETYPPGPGRRESISQRRPKQYRQGAASSGKAAANDSQAESNDGSLLKSPDRLSVVPESTTHAEKIAVQELSKKVSLSTETDKKKPVTPDSTSTKSTRDVQTHYVELQHPLDTAIVDTQTTLLHAETDKKGAPNTDKFDSQKSEESLDNNETNNKVSTITPSTAELVTDPDTPSKTTEETPARTGTEKAAENLKDFPTLAEAHKTPPRKVSVRRQTQNSTPENTSVSTATKTPEKQGSYPILESKKLSRIKNQLPKKHVDTKSTTKEPSLCGADSSQETQQSKGRVDTTDSSENQDLSKERKDISNGEVSKKDLAQLNAPQATTSMPSTQGHVRKSSAKSLGLNIDNQSPTKVKKDPNDDSSKAPLVNQSIGRDLDPSSLGQSDTIQRKEKHGTKAKSRTQSNVEKGNFQASSEGSASESMTSARHENKTDPQNVTPPIQRSIALDSRVANEGSGRAGETVDTVVTAESHNIDDHIDTLSPRPENSEQDSVKKSKIDTMVDQIERKGSAENVVDGAGALVEQDSSANQEKSLSDPAKANLPSSHTRKDSTTKCNEPDKTQKQAFGEFASVDNMVPMEAISTHKKKKKNSKPKPLCLKKGSKEITEGVYSPPISKPTESSSGSTTTSSPTKLPTPRESAPYSLMAPTYPERLEDSCSKEPGIDNFSLGGEEQSQVETPEKTPEFTIDLVEILDKLANLDPESRLPVIYELLPDLATDPLSNTTVHYFPDNMTTFIDQSGQVRLSTEPEEPSSPQKASTEDPQQFKFLDLGPYDKAFRDHSGVESSSNDGSLTISDELVIDYYRQKHHPGGYTEVVSQATNPKSHQTTTDLSASETTLENSEDDDTKEISSDSSHKYVIEIKASEHVHELMSAIKARNLANTRCENDNSEGESQNVIGRRYSQAKHGNEYLRLLKPSEKPRTKPGNTEQDDMSAPPEKDSDLGILFVEMGCSEEEIREVMTGIRTRFNELWDETSIPGVGYANVLHELRSPLMGDEQKDKSTSSEGHETDPTIMEPEIAAAGSPAPSPQAGLGPLNDSGIDNICAESQHDIASSKEPMSTLNSPFTPYFDSLSSPERLTEINIPTTYNTIRKDPGNSPTSEVIPAPQTALEQDTAEHSTSPSVSFVTPREHPEDYPPLGNPVQSQKERKNSARSYSEVLACGSTSSHNLAEESSEFTSEQETPNESSENEADQA